MIHQVGAGEPLWGPDLRYDACKLSALMRFLPDS